MGRRWELSRWVLEGKTCPVLPGRGKVPKMSMQAAPHPTPTRPTSGGTRTSPILVVEPSLGPTQIWRRSNPQPKSTRGGRSEESWEGSTQIVTSFWKHSPSLLRHSVGDQACVTKSAMHEARARITSQWSLSLTVTRGKKSSILPAITESVSSVSAKGETKMENEIRHIRVRAFMLFPNSTRCGTQNDRR